ncbi:MAG: hypothetical protein IJA10_10320 [Lachnospiraceae bacterium]|nr:hypothetical protein [Lachnospiraceae bacterium]
MSVYDFYKRAMKIESNSTGKNYPTLGEKLKHNSDLLMEATWDRNIQSKVCYIYDYFHDDQPELNIGMTYENTTKTRIDAKFIVKSYQSIDKDQVEYHLQFKPSQKMYFNETDELYYFETNYRKKYGVQDFPIGMYVDIPDDTGLYHKWLICSKESANQFVKYLILPCDYFLHWVEKDGQNKYKRSMWCVQRQQSSYTIGVYQDRYFEHADNQTKLWFELNSITEKFWYNDENNKTMRLIVSAPTDKPITWSVTKVENSKPIGIQKLTLYQDFYNPHTDYLERDDKGNIVAMYADYYDSNIEPSDQQTSVDVESNIYGKIIASTSTIKVGGSYKTMTLKLYDKDNNDITNDYLHASFDWECNIDGVDDLDLSNIITMIKGKEFNQRKIKFADDRRYLNKILNVKCTIIKDTDVINTDVINVEGKFELII